MVWRFKIIQRARLLRPRNKSENTTSAIVDHDNSKIVWYVIVPQRIAVVHKTDIARNKQGIFFNGIRRANGGACAAVNAACAAVAKNSPVFVAVEKLCIAYHGTVAQLEVRMVWKGCLKSVKHFQIGNRTSFHKFLVFLQSEFFFMQPKMLIIALF